MGDTEFNKRTTLVKLENKAVYLFIVLRQEGPIITQWAYHNTVMLCLHYVMYSNNQICLILAEDCDVLSQQ